MTDKDAERADSLSDEQHAEYYDWRMKNGKPDSRTNREAFRAGWLARLDVKA